MTSAGAGAVDADPAEPGAALGRRAAVVSLVALAAFWVLVVLGGRLQPGYRPSRDFVSALAAEGARYPAIGVLALFSFGVAYLAAAVVLQAWVGTAFGAVLLAVSGLLTWLVAIARIHCPAGSAYCGLARPGGSGMLAADSGSRFGPHLHGWGVATSYAVVLVAMVWLGYLWWGRHHPLRTLGCVAAFVSSLATVPFWLGSDTPGLAQRVWLGILTAFVVLICARPLLDGRASEEADA